MNEFKYFFIVTYIIILILFGFGCIRSINKNKTLFNMLLEYYPEYNIKILNQDPNLILIQIKK